MSANVIVVFLGLIVAALVYFVPAVVAFSRGVPNKGSVLVLNLFLGWTLVGWVVALAMAARSAPQGPRY
ncbi:superinfection immunity protein [Streptomyces sp. NBC_00236]|uniref:superinfection immunity protein n=1 Tax=unclassified Streptomyces TaxID=2593676 RepID=UPI002E2B5651|nr:superinfection immunity protein [Streptomyces sp. NBC_00236]